MLFRSLKEVYNGILLPLGHPDPFGYIARVCKADVPELRYRDKFTEDDGTTWSVMERQRIIDDRIAGTWRATVVTEERQVF